MNQAAVIEYITDTFNDVEVVESSGDYFFFYDPEQQVQSDHRFPFITLVTSDNYDNVSNLNRSSVFRLNIGLSKDTFRSVFDTEDSSTDNNYDFTEFDKLMPHPVYGKMYWCCVLNPGETTTEKVKELLAEAYDMSVKKYVRRATAK
ncbi:MAG: hypothetical protein JWR38_5129 [Mucilaginibacter sp.]|nr:hypothetical protein [Mucilaginibacter sp.]